MLEMRSLKPPRVHTRCADNPSMSMIDEVVCDYVCMCWGLVMCVRTCVWVTAVWKVPMD